MTETPYLLLRMVLRSALLWSTVSVLLVFFVRKAATARWSRRVTNVLLTVALYQFASALWCFLLPISGKVTDAETGKPLAGIPVYSRWLGLAPSWENWCWASQRTFTDQHGEFHFRLPPVSTMLPVFERDTWVSVPGRIALSQSGRWLLPVVSDLQMKRFVPEQSIASGPQVHGSDCSSKRTLSLDFFQETYRDYPNAYRELYDDACVAANSATRTDRYFKDLTEAWAHEYEMTLPRPMTEWNDPMRKVVQAPGELLHRRMQGFGYGCGQESPGICARAIDESLAQVLCSLVAPRTDFRPEAQP